MKTTATLIACAALLQPVNAYSPSPIINVAAKGMSLLKPIFQAEAKLQAAALGALSSVDKEEIKAEIALAKQQNKALIYTYGLSPFSSEAVNILESTGYEFTVQELGAEWFLLGGKGSVARVALSEEVESGATSLPKVFIGGQCVGGCTELSELANSGELETLLSKAKVPRKGAAAKKPAFSLFN